MFIDITCDCGAVFVIRIRDQGQLRKCNHCGAQLVVPALKNMPFYKMLESPQSSDAEDTEEYDDFA